MSPTTPIILLAFVNDADDPLRGLAEEHDALQEILKIPQREGKCKVITLMAATPEKLIQKFQEYQHRIRIFHYAGHSDQDAIFLGKDYPGQSATQATNLAGFLGLQKGLELVFLNSCLSMGQAEAYQQAGIPAVLATNVKINDSTAVNFAKVFYQGIAGGATITEAYQQADRGMQITDDTASRGQGLPYISDIPLWQLFPEKDHTWRLPLVAKRLTKIPTLDLKKEFFGREEDLKRLVKKLENSTKVVLMNGLGGIGKTVLATAYTQNQQQHYDHIAWINRGEDLINSFALNGDLAETLGMPIEKDDPPQERFSRILHKLRNLPGNNLLVIDNAQQQVAQKEIYDMLPGHPNWRVLLTSRLDLQQFDPIRLDTLGVEAARKLFQQHYQGEYTAAELNDLLEEIGYHTLTIELLARLLARLNNLMSVSKLTAIMREKQLDDPDLQELIYSQHSGTERGIYMHLMKAFELTGLKEEETWLLKQFVVLPIEEYPVGKFAELLNNKPLPINKLLNRLAKAGVLIRHKNGNFSVHPLIRQVAEYQLQPDYYDLERLVEVLTVKMIQKEYGDLVKDNLPWVSYAIEVAKYLDEIENADTIALQKHLALVLWKLDDRKRSKDLFEKVHYWTVSNYHPNHHEVGNSYSNLASVYKGFGNYDKAEEFYEKALKLAVDNFGHKHHTTATRTSNLGLMYRDLGILKKARRLLEKALRLHEQEFGPYNPSTAISYVNLAIVLQDLGEFKEAKDLLEKARKSDEQTFGKDHHETAVTYFALAKVLRDLGNYSEAKILFQKVLEINKNCFGLNHEKTILSYSFLGLILNNLGEFEDAQTLLKKAIKLSESNFDFDDSTTAVCYKNMGQAFRDSGKLHDATVFFKKAMKSCEKTLGPDHTITAMSYLDLGLLFKDLGKNQKAIAMLLKALKIFIDRLGPDHPYTKIAQRHLDNLK